MQVNESRPGLSIWRVLHARLDIFLSLQIVLQVCDVATFWSRNLRGVTLHLVRSHCSLFPFACNQRSCLAHFETLGCCRQSWRCRRCWLPKQFSNSGRPGGISWLTAFKRLTYFSSEASTWETKRNRKHAMVSLILLDSLPGSGRKGELVQKESRGIYGGHTCDCEWHRPGWHLDHLQKVWLRSRRVERE